MAARNVGFNSTFEQQRQVINQIAVDVYTLQNSGLLTSFTESDPVFTASPSSGITTTNISQWNTSYGWGNHAVVGYATIGYVDSEISNISIFDQDLNTTNDVTFNRLGITAGQINVGLNSDLLINLEGEGTTTYTFGVGGTLNIPGNLEIGSAGEYVLFNNTGSHIQADQNYDFRIHVGGFANKVWAFSTDGSTTLPNGTQIVDIGNPIGELPTSGLALGNNRFQVSFGSTINDWALFNGADLIQFESDNYISLIAGNSVNITGGGIEGPTWQFNSNGTITFPDSTVQSTAYTGSVGSAGTWAVNAIGIHTTKNVGIGTTLPSSALTVQGDGKFSGVVTATKFQSNVAGTPTIDSPNNLNINAVQVAISTDLSVGRNITATGIVSASSISASTISATSFSGIGSNITNIRLPWTKFYLNTQNNVKPPVGIITSSDYLGRNWGSWYSCTFLNSSFTAGLSPSNAAYNPTLDGVGFTTDRFFGFLQGATYEFQMEMDVYDGAGRAAEVELYAWESSTGAFSNQSLWYPGSAVGNNPLRVHHTALFTFTSSTTSNNWVRYKLHGNMNSTYYISQAILTIKKIA